MKNIKSAFKATGILPLNPIVSLVSIPEQLLQILSKCNQMHLVLLNPLLLGIPGELESDICTKDIQLVQDPQVRLLIDKLANAAIGGITEGFLGQDRTIQVEAGMAAQAEAANDAVLTDTPTTTICQSVDRLANGTLFTVRSTGTPIVHRLVLDRPIHQLIGGSVNPFPNHADW